MAGGMETAMILRESCRVGTWVESSKATEKKLNRIQVRFVRFLLQVGQGAPLASLMWDTSLRDMGLQIKLEKIM